MWKSDMARRNGGPDIYEGLYWDKRCAGGGKADGRGVLALRARGLRVRAWSCALRRTFIAA